MAAVRILTDVLRGVLSPLWMQNAFFAKLTPQSGLNRLYLAVLGLLGLGLGAVIRFSAGAVAVLFGVLFVPSILITLLPYRIVPMSWGRWPSQATPATLTLAAEAA